MTSDKIVIAHRGASGYLPEHTLPAYAMAYALGADFLEPDLVATRDGVLICCHDIHLDRTTDVAARYPDRARADGRWYAADFTLAEVRTLAAQERFDAAGDRVFESRFSAAAQGFAVPTLAELLGLISALNRQSGRCVGVYPETKEPAFHDAHNLSLEPPLLALLADYGYVGREAPVFVQSFSATHLRLMREQLGSELPMIQLIGDSPDEADHITPAGLDAIAAYADGIGPDKQLIADSAGQLVVEAHRRGLCVHPYTFRADQLGAGYTDLGTELSAYYYGYGVDGLFTDFCDIAVELVYPQQPRRLHR
ncbi:glycerophosphodiester phosphodiesterase [Salinisphaera sp. SPP-AMP-43]|uniref:glycerophosphodiester phosphodiesterase n=1 Tax=Salinisphaera sp. SPP-AMP-43 TaxID=3121288 RepID=UPI003C6E41BA